MTPSVRLVRLALFWAVLGLAAAILQIQGIWGWASLGMLCLLLVDAWRGWKVPDLGLRRTVPRIWSQGRSGEVMLELENPLGRTLSLTVHDHFPSGWSVPLKALPLRLPAGSRLEQAYLAKPSARGKAVFEPALLEIASPFGLWQRRARIGDTQPVKVYPDVVPLLGHGLLGARDPRIGHGGMLRTRRRGEGTDFHQLREYRRGDSLRAIDWKATSRLGKPISREFQEERDQQIVFLLDCGRRMLSVDGDRTHFEHALEALLRLGWVAARQGDAVGVQTFAGSDVWLAPRKGRPGFDQTVTGLHDVHPTDAAPDYLMAAQTLVRRLKRRALIVVLTNLRDEDDDTLRAALGLLGSRHLVLCASLRESLLDEMLQAPVEDFHAALSNASAQVYLQDRARFRRRSGLSAATLIDAVPRELPLLLVDRYLEIKNSARL